MAVQHFSTDNYSLLRPEQDPDIRRLFVRTSPVDQLMRLIGSDRETDSFAIEFDLQTRRARSAGFRSGDDNLPSTRRPVGGVNRTSSNLYNRVRQQMAYLYSTRYIHGIEAALAGQSGRGRNLELKAAEAELLDLGDQKGVQALGNGTGEIGVVASVAAGVITLRTSNGTVALAGFYGPLHDYQGCSVRFHDPTTGAVRNDGNGLGWEIIDDAATGATATITLDRSAAGTVQAGDLVVEGDDDDGSYAKMGPGLDAACDDGTDTATLYGRPRNSAGWLRGYRRDLQVGGQLAELTPWGLSSFVTDLIDYSGEVPDVVLMPPKQELEWAYGALQGNDANFSRTQPSPYALVRFTKQTDLAAGATVVECIVGQRRLRLTKMHAMRDHANFVFRGANFQLVRWKSGLVSIDTSTGGERIVGLHAYERGRMAAHAFVIQNPRSFGRLVNVAHRRRFAA